MILYITSLVSDLLWIVKEVLNGHYFMISKSGTIYFFYKNLFSGLSVKTISWKSSFGDEWIESITDFTKKPIKRDTIRVI